MGFLNKIYSCILLAGGYAHIVHSAPTDKKINLRTLIISENDEDGQIARVALSGIGSQYTIAKPDSLPALERADGNVNYNAIVWCSKVEDEAQLENIREFAAKNGIRIVVLNSGPSADTVTEKSESVKKGMNLVFDNSTFAQEISDVMNYSGFWPTSHSVRGANPAKPSGGSTTLFPVLRFSPSKVPSDKGDLAAFVAKTPLGSEEMHFAFNAAANELCNGEDGCETDTPNYVQEGEFTQVNLALANIWHTWATRGLFLGRRNMNLHVQLDDIFRPAPMFGFKNESEAPVVRQKGTDIESAVAYQNEAPSRLNLPSGSEIKFEFAFNGAWIAAKSTEDSGLVAAINNLSSNFNWVSHTFMHTNMDWLDKAECGGKPSTCPTSRARNDLELSINRMIADGKAVNISDMASEPACAAFNVTPACQIFGCNDVLKNERYSPESLITPQISGLFPKSAPVPEPDPTYSDAPLPRPRNLDATEAMKAAGVRNVVGDNSRKELMVPGKPHHAIVTTVDEHGVDGILIIPRFVTGINWNLHNGDIFTKAYNEGGWCSYQYGFECKEGADLTLEDAILREARAAVHMFLQYRQDPYMFHQANLMFFNHEGKDVSLLTMWVDSVIKEMQRYVDGLVVRSPKQDEAGNNYRERMAYDNCGIEATLQLIGGKPSTVSFSTNGNNCTAYLTAGNVTTRVEAGSQNTTVDVSILPAWV
eukprot:comp19389_c2_seq1/m.22403 comp19389_c2_seq1/g.22403  ORF comp19389_c2_seq1/g.22403 comp19389_c2_seq1/m.22403 type:complete len:705 (-) comp19389_c2_seq1:21-2135(-)